MKERDEFAQSNRRNRPAAHVDVQFRAGAADFADTWNAHDPFKKGPLVAF